VSPPVAFSRASGYPDAVLSSVAGLDVRSFSRLFRALSDETRIRIVALLSHGELCVCHIENALELGQSNVSRHLAVLKAAAVVESRRDGTWVYYSLVTQDDPELQVVLDGIKRALGAQRVLRTDLVRLKKSCGPGACD
jgi:ArsR family transcriptional regulator, arsenate/arsenite/antimonite-responsive transcriptional repressor